MEKSSADRALAVERTTDYEAIRKLATHPAVFSKICDDFSNDPRGWQATRHPAMVYLLARNEGQPIGFAAFFPKNAICWEMHFAFLPSAYGSAAEQALRSMFDWIWTYTRCVRIVGEICRENRLAIRFALRCGVELCGIHARSRMKNGKLQDQVILGISKP